MLITQCLNGLRNWEGDLLAGGEAFHRNGRVFDLFLANDDSVRDAFFVSILELFVELVIRIWIELGVDGCITKRLRDLQGLSL